MVHAGFVRSLSLYRSFILGRYRSFVRSSSLSPSPPSFSVSFRHVPPAAVPPSAVRVAQQEPKNFPSRDMQSSC